MATKFQAMNIRVFVLVVMAAAAFAQAQTVRELAPGDSLGHALSLKAAANLRDLGGYKTADGRTVVRGLVYRPDE
jgi:hypothetical protein